MKKHTDPIQPQRLALLAIADPMWHKAYAEACERLSFEIHSVSRGFDAIDRLRRHRYDLVVGHDSLDDLTLFELSLYVKDFAERAPDVVLLGLDPATLPMKIRQDRHLHATIFAHEGLEIVTDLFESDRPDDSPRVVAPAIASAPAETDAHVSERAVGGVSILYGIP